MAFNTALAKTQISNVIQATNPNRPAIILQCLIMDVNPSRLTVDVFVPETSAYYNDVPMSFPTKGKGYGIYSMPAKNMSALLCINDTSRKPSVLAAFTSSSDVANSVSQIREIVFPGENLLTGIGGGFIKQDQSGMVMIGSKDMNVAMFSGSGDIQSSSLGYRENHLGSSKIGGVHFPKTIDHKNSAQLFTSEIKIVNREEIYSGIENKTAYAVDSIYDDETHTISAIIKAQIISDASETVALIQGDTTYGGIAKILDDFSNSFRDLITDEEFETKLSDVQNFINRYILANKGVKITIDKGYSISGDLEDINDILKQSSFEMSSANYPVCLKMNIIDIATSTEKAKISLDTDGNCFVKIKKMRIEADSFEFVEVT